MDVTAVLALYDAQMRRAPAIGSVEVAGPVVRIVDREAGWAGVLWSDLDDENADAIIARELEFFAGVGLPWEWKYHSHDRPADLPERLRAAGLDGGEPEAVMVAEPAALALDVRPPDGVTLREVVSSSDVEAYVRVQTEVFGGDHCALPPGAVAFVAWAADRPIGAGRLELAPERDFAGIWSGATVPDWRHRGVFRALVSARAAVAAAHGYRYLQVDAGPHSQPILQRLGFVAIATTIPFVAKITAPR